MGRWWVRAGGGGGEEPLRGHTEVLGPVLQTVVILENDGIMASPLYSLDPGVPFHPGSGPPDRSLVAGYLLCASQ